MPININYALEEFRKSPLRVSEAVSRGLGIEFKDPRNYQHPGSKMSVAYTRSKVYPAIISSLELAERKGFFKIFTQAPQFDKKVEAELSQSLPKLNLDQALVEIAKKVFTRLERTIDETQKAVRDNLIELFTGMLANFNEIPVRVARLIPQFMESVVSESDIFAERLRDGFGNLVDKEVSYRAIAMKLAAKLSNGSKEACQEASNNIHLLLDNLSKLRFDSFNQFTAFASQAQTNEKARNRHFELKVIKNKATLVAKEELITDYLKSASTKEMEGPAFGCPARYVKLANGENLITAMHHWLSQVFDKYLLPHLDQILRNEAQASAR